MRPVDQSIALVGSDHAGCLRTVPHIRGASRVATHLDAAPQIRLLHRVYDILQLTACSFMCCTASSIRPSAYVALSVVNTCCPRFAISTQRATAEIPSSQKQGTRRHRVPKK